MYKERKNYIVKLGNYEFKVRAADEKAAESIAFTIWLDNEDLYPENFSEIEVREVPLI